MSEAVITRVDGPATRAATGLSIYFPVFERHFSQGYLYLPEVRTWPDVLTAYYGAGAAIPADERASFVEETGGAEYFFDEDGLNIFGYFDLAATDKRRRPKLTEQELGEAARALVERARLVVDAAEAMGAPEGQLKPLRGELAAARTHHHHLLELHALQPVFTADAALDGDYHVFL